MQQEIVLSRSTATRHRPLLFAVTGVARQKKVAWNRRKWDIDRMAGQGKIDGDKLRRIVKSRGITLGDLALKVGVHRQALSSIINHNAKPRPGTLQRLLTALDVTAADLAPDLREDEQQLLDEYRGVDDRTRKAMLGMVIRMADEFGARRVEEHMTAGIERLEASSPERQASGRRKGRAGA
ncbi:MAG: helix-turn-helix transcriptional regulator [Phycisphaerae bacterium]|nr:helix-turn-helix transcriptional regulator [Phycisphaerae bacterium]